MTTGKGSADRRGRQPGVGNVIQGSGTGGADFRLRAVGPVSSDGKDGGRDAHRVITRDHREAGAAEPRQYVVDASGGGNSGGSGDTVGGHVHWLLTGYGIPVGGVATYF